MSGVSDSGRFVFNKSKPISYIGAREGNPSKPDNIENKEGVNESYSPKDLYTYSMGIAEIEANNSSYEEVNIYVSKPIKINENVLEVSIDTLEEHPVFDEVSGRASKRQTSVEYYLSLNDKPTINDWIPILPEGTTHIKGERLLIDGINAKTLFPFRMHTVVIYEDGIKLDKIKYHVLNSQEVQLEEYNTDRVYTIDYEPNSFVKNPYTLEVNDYKYKTERITESFPRGTDSNKTITLKHVPYIDREKLLEVDNYNPNTSEYRPVVVEIEDASIRNAQGISKNYVPPVKGEDGDPYMNNKTLYLDNSWSQMNNYNLEEGYVGLDYYQNKNKITFANHINIPMIEENEKETPGTGTIKVSYDALVTNFRLKIILRRNTQKEVTATPRVKEYELKFKSTR